MLSPATPSSREAGRAHSLLAGERDEHGRGRSSGHQDCGAGHSDGWWPRAAQGGGRQREQALPLLLQERYEASIAAYSCLKLPYVLSNACCKR